MGPFPALDTSACWQIPSQPQRREGALHFHITRNYGLTYVHAHNSLLRLLSLSALRPAIRPSALLLSVHLLGLNGLQLRLLGLYSFTLSTKTESPRAFLLPFHLLELNWPQQHLLRLYSFTLSTKTDPVLSLAALRPAIRPRGLSAISSVIRALHLTRRQTEVWAATGQRY